MILSLLMAQSIFAQGIRVDGGYLVNSGTINLSQDFNLEVNSTLNSQTNSQISFEGNSLQSINGSGNLNFSSIRLNNSGAGVHLNANASLSETLYLVSGDFDLLDYNLDLGSTGMVSGENSNSMIKSTDGSGNYINGSNAGDGKILNSVSISTSGLNDVGGLGIDVIPSINWGSCLVWRDHQQVVGVQSDISVFRKYTILPTNAANIQASVSIEYDASELNGNTSGSLKMYQLKDNGAKGVDWEELVSFDNGTKVTATTNDNNLAELTVTLAGSGSVLPVSLLSFDAYCDDNYVRLQWKTASELNNDYFILEKSIDGILFLEIAMISGQGSSNKLTQYEFLDFNDSDKPIYYRLSQIDYDGKKTIYKPLVSQCGNGDAISFKVVNPAHNQIILLSNKLLNQEVTAYLYDMGGKQLMVKALSQNQQRWVFPMVQFNDGVYQLLLRGVDFVDTKSIILIKD